MSDKRLVVFGDESKLVKGTIGYYDENGWPVVVAEINQYRDVVSNPLDIAYKMAAAPDMLEALEYCLELLGSEFDLPKIEAAITKAKGESRHG